MKWTVNGTEGHLTGGWEDQGKLPGGGDHELETAEIEGLRGRVVQNEARKTVGTESVLSH